MHNRQKNERKMCKMGGNSMQEQKKSPHWEGDASQWGRVCWAQAGRTTRR